MFYTGGWRDWHWGRYNRVWHVFVRRESQAPAGQLWGLAHWCSKLKNTAHWCRERCHKWLTDGRTDAEQTQDVWETHSRCWLVGRLVGRLVVHSSPTSLVVKNRRRRNVFKIEDSCQPVCCVFLSLATKRCYSNTTVWFSFVCLSAGA